MTTPSLQCLLTFEHRAKKKTQIEAYFENHLGERLASRDLHYKFGSSVRTRISEINRDPAAEIRIINNHYFDAAEGAEISYYKAERR